MEPEQAKHDPEEMRLLKLLSELRPLLRNAIDSLDGKTSPAPEASYLRWCAVTVSHAAAGYLMLRERGAIHASKFQIRPALEATFNGIAAINANGFLFRRAYTEWLEDKKLAHGNPATMKELDDQFEEVKRQFPSCSQDLAKVSVYDAAKMADLLPVYETAYRVYCQFTHGALRAANGGLNEASDGHDTFTVACCVLLLLKALKGHTPAEIPNLARFVKELESRNET